MTWLQWFPLALVCLLGAMSPGPSLAVVARHTVVAGTRAGVVCAVTHGCGIFCWALLMVSGLGAILLTQPAWFDTIRYLGAAFLFIGPSRGAIRSSGRESHRGRRPHSRATGWLGRFPAGAV